MLTAPSMIITSGSSLYELVEDAVCPFGRMASAQVLLVPTPFCRRDTTELDSLKDIKQDAEEIIERCRKTNPLLITDLARKNG